MRHKGRLVPLGILTIYALNVGRVAVRALNHVYRHPTVDFNHHFTFACAACHGVDGKGNKALGAPNLTDDYWLHGWGEAAIINIIKNGKSNVMPAQAPMLSAEQIRVVAAYVISLAKTEPGSTAGAVTAKPP